MNPLISWVGAGGKPVSHGKAERRAAVCVVCPKNGHGKWWERSKEKIADSIKELLSFKAKRRLFVSCEDQLFMCSACGCALRLKVHAPIEHITDNITDQQLSKLHNDCWILKET